MSTCWPFSFESLSRGERASFALQAIRSVSPPRDLQRWSPRRTIPKTIPKRYANLSKKNWVTSWSQNRPKRWWMLLVVRRSVGMKSGALAEWYFEVSSYEWPKPMFFANFQRPADWRDRKMRTTWETNDKLRNSRWICLRELPSVGESGSVLKRMQAKTVGWGSNVDDTLQNRKPCKTIGAYYFDDALE